MNIRPRVAGVKTAGTIGGVGAMALTVDPVTAARRLLGARLYGRDVTATIVEVEAYGGPPTGPGRIRHRTRSADHGCATR